jgi:hypothetical protein
VIAENTFTRYHIEEIIWLLCSSYLYLCILDYFECYLNDLSHIRPMYSSTHNRRIPEQEAVALNRD